MYLKLINHVNFCIKNNKSFTIRLDENNKLDRPKYGYIISITPLINIGMNTNEMIEYIVSNRYIKIDNNHHKLYIGGWVDNGKLSTDISVLSEYKNKAIQIAKYCNQNAVYDLNKNETINIKD